jgi:hypothetical protein
VTRPVLFYTLVRKWHIGGYEVMRVTTEKSAHLHGSMAPDWVPTHCLYRDTIGRFPTEAAARDRIKAADEVRQRFAPLIKRAREREIRVEQAQRDAINKVILAPTEPLVLTP